MAVDPTNDDVYLAVSGACRPGLGGVYRSCDRGKRWEYVSRGLPVGVDLFKDEVWKYSARQFEFGADGSLLLSAQKTGEVFRFDRKTESWIKLDFGKCYQLPVADPHVPGRFVKPGESAQVSVDGGCTFKPAPGFSNFSHIAFDMMTPGLVVGVGFDSIHVSQDGGRTFRELPGGMGLPSGGRRHAFVNDRKLYYLTTGSGMWTADLKIEN